jgi:septal ring factor EnvC (AmiA/AmiB activator)
MRIWRLISAVFALTLAFTSYAQDTRTQESKKAKLQREIEIINSQLKDNSAKSRSALTELTLVRKKITNLNGLIDESNRRISVLGDSISFKQKRIDTLEARLGTLSDYYGKLVKSAYKNRDSRIWYMYILSSGNLTQGLRRTVYLKNFSSEMKRQAKEVSAAKEALEEEKDAMEGLLEEVSKEKASRMSDMRSLESSRKQSEDLVASLNRDKKKYTGELQKKQRQVEALNREIAEIIRKAMAEQQKKKSSSGKKGDSKASATTPSGKSTDTTVDSKLSKEFAANKGKLPWPVSGTIVESFGEHYHPVYKNVKLPFNNGVNVAVAKGAAVKAVFDGEVRQIVVMPGYNQCVLVQHGNYFTFYCKLSKVSVKNGDKIKTGHVIGTVDTIGDETQLHFQLWSGRTPQNPELWLRK